MNKDRVRPCYTEHTSSVASPKAEMNYLSIPGNYSYNSSLGAAFTL